MSTQGIRVLTVGKPFNLPADYEVHHLNDSGNVLHVIAMFVPDVIVTSTFIPGALNAAPFDVRKKWINVPPDAPDDAIVGAIESSYAANLWGTHPNQKFNPLMSVYTPTRNAGDFIGGAYQSLRDQTYGNWEWVVIDDRSDDGTWERLQEFARDDYRVRPYRNGKICGKIGAQKDVATRLCRGAYLIELDHDDELMETCLAEVRQAFEQHPEVGMVYSNSANYFENGQPHKFDDDFWKGRYREIDYRGRKIVECLNPDIYDRFGPHYSQQFGWFLTVGPNHVRAFRASTFQELGGYNPNLPVADDWDLYARFFLRSKCLHLDKCLYFYRFRDNWANATFKKNKSIQDHLALGRNHYQQEFAFFNYARLNPGPPTREILLTVAVCGIPERVKPFADVAAKLVKQAEGQPVEVLYLVDNKISPIGEKRNWAVGAAKGRFIAFVDDDDDITEDYVVEIVKAIESDPHADCVVFDVLVHGYDAQPKVCRYGIEYKHSKDQDAYYRRPGHLMACRTAVARKHPYKIMRVSEDLDWSFRASADMQRQVRIDKVLYHYKYDALRSYQPRAKDLTFADVSFVVPKAAEHPLVMRCLRSIRQCAPGAEIVLVANGCPATAEERESVDAVAELEMNVGFAAGCNIGANCASRRVVCFMNDDAAFVDETPLKLIGAVAPDLIVAPYSNKAKPPQGDVARESVPVVDLAVDAVVGLCMMIWKQTFQALGGFDPRFLNYDDDDLCLRAARQGIKCKVIGSTFIQHERHATFKALNLDVSSILDENRRRFGRKHPRIRVIAIAKDEEAAIPGFFEQFSGLTRHWHLLDTGSTDRTVEVARRMGVSVESAPFTDFADARNAALARFAADGDWVITLDPDERLDEHTLKHLEEFLASTDSEVLLAPLKASYPDGSIRQFVPKPFAHRRTRHVHWAFKVHEKLLGSHKQALVVNAEINHVIALHGTGRRSGAEGMYKALMQAEPYFTDLAFKAKMRSEWPILDYDRMDDPRIRKVFIGPLVSVVVPTFKRPDLVRRAVHSALRQDYTNLEAVVVGDHCPDLKVRSYGRLRVFNLPKNHGAGGATPRNYAMILAAGALIGYVDDDNALAPDHISSLYEALRLSGKAWAFSSMQVDGKDLKFDEPREKRIDTSCLLHPKGFVAKYGLWKSRAEAGTYAHDWEFVQRWLAGGESWICTRKPTLIYNAETSGQAEFLKRLVEA